MRRYLLDTSPLAALLLARPAAVALITPWMERHEAATSILVYAEVVEYIALLTASEEMDIRSVPAKNRLKAVCL